MKTIKEIAEEIGVSKQAVYKRYKGKLHESVKLYVRTVDGTIRIMEQGENIIKQDFSSDTTYAWRSMERTCEELVFMLKRELMIKNRQITELTAVIRMQAKRENYTWKSKSRTSAKPASQTSKNVLVLQHVSRLKAEKPPSIEEESLPLHRDNS